MMLTTPSNHERKLINESRTGIKYLSAHCHYSDMEMSSADRCAIIAAHNRNGKCNPYAVASVDRDCVFLIKASMFEDSPQHVGLFYRVQAGGGACGQKPLCP